MKAGRRTVRVALAALALLVTPPAGYYAWDLLVWHNLGAVEPGRVYRSGQMPASALAATLHRHKIKTVLNLRGQNSSRPWYRAEREATTAAGATQVDIALSSCEWMSRAQLRSLVRVLDTCDYPILVHCQHGSERTGWVSAVATLLRPGSTLDDARRQFSLSYLFVPWYGDQLMSDHLDLYARWLDSQGWTHTPERFRLWAALGFQPGLPGREAWPYDPFPLVVITRPSAEASAAAESGVGVRR